MIQQIFLHNIGKITETLIEEKSFFSLSADDKKAKAKHLPSSIQSYLVETSEESFLSELKEIVRLLKSNKIEEVYPKNQLAQSVANYLLNEVAELMDKIPVEFYQLSYEKRRSFLEGKKLPSVFVDIFSGKSYQQIFESTYDFIKSVKKDSPYIVVQFARDPEGSVKKEIREHFKKTYPAAFPRLQVSKYLLGGMRTLVNGKVTDQSWVGKIEQFTSQIELKK